MIYNEGYKWISQTELWPNCYHLPSQDMLEAHCYGECLRLSVLSVVLREIERVLWRMFLIHMEVDGRWHQFTFVFVFIVCLNWAELSLEVLCCCSLYYYVLLQKCAEVSLCLLLFVLFTDEMFFCSQQTAASWLRICSKPTVRCIFSDPLFFGQHVDTWCWCPNSMSLSCIGKTVPLRSASIILHLGQN